MMSLACSGQGFNTLQEAYAALGFDPHQPGNVVVVHASDVHMNLHIEGVPAPVATTNLDHRMVRVINEMNPQPAKILFSGDVSSSMAAVPGGDATGKPLPYTYATNEMIFFRNSLAALTNIHATNILWIPGNHDVGAFESDAQTFRMIFPNMPPYQRFELAGMHWFLVNPGNYGTPDEKQSDWLRAEVAQISPTNKVVVMTHQPPFSNPVAHRGMGLLLREVFGEWQTPWWLLAGHEHARALQTWKVGNSKVAEVVAGPATTNTFVGFNYDVGFVIHCVSNGIVGQVYYHYSYDHFRVWNQPSWDFPREYAAAFEKVPGLLWRRLKPGYGSLPEQLQAEALDSIEWWAYPRVLEWRMPLADHGNRATHFLLAVAGLTPTAVVECSSDRENWIELSASQSEFLIHAYPIPESMRTLPSAYLRFRSQDSGNNWVGGWGLATTNGPGGFSYPRLSQVPDLVAYPGRSIAIQLQATNPYSPPDKLRFRLVSGPSGAAVDARAGVFTWQPGASSEPGVYPITVAVADEGTPPAGDTKAFNVQLLNGGGPVLSSLRVIPPGGAGFDIIGDPGAYTVSYTTDYENWNVLCVTNTPTLQAAVEIGATGQSTCQFFRVKQTAGVASASAPVPWPARPPYVVDLKLPATQFHVQQSTNLVHWDDLKQVTVPGQAIQIPDPSAEQWAPRVYKAERSQL